VGTVKQKDMEEEEEKRGNRQGANRPARQRKKMREVEKEVSPCQCMQLTIMYIYVLQQPL